MASSISRPRVLQLPVALTDADLRERHARILEIITELATVREEARAEAAARREHVKSLDEELQRIASETRRGCVEREVQCAEQLDMDTLEARLVRLDTGEVLQTRALSPDERQLSLADIV